MTIGMVSIIYSGHFHSPSQFYFTRFLSELGIKFWCKADFDLIWAEYSVILLFVSKKMKKRPYLQVCAIRLCAVCIKCFVYMHARFRFNLGWIFCNSVILLFFSKTMEKRPYICKLLQSALYVLNVLFIHSVHVCICYF